MFRPLAELFQIVYAKSQYIRQYTFTWYWSKNRRSEACIGVEGDRLFHRHETVISDFTWLWNGTRDGINPASRGLTEADNKVSKGFRRTKLTPVGFQLSFYCMKCNETWSFLL